MSAGSARSLLRAWAAPLLRSVLLITVTGCGRLRTPESSCESLRDAIWEADGIAVYDALIQNTQWSISTVNKLHLQMAAQIRASYPPSQQDAALARLYAASASSGRELFLSLYGERYAADFRPRVAQQMPLRIESDGSASCGPVAGKPFRLGRGLDGKWGLSELDREWEDAKLRAYHDLATVEKNVALYRVVGTKPEPPKGEVGSR